MRLSWIGRGNVLRSEAPKNPWGGRASGSGGGDKGGDGGGDKPGEGGDTGPRNPWAAPPGGPRPRGNRGSVTSLDDFLKRARGGGGGSGGGGGGMRFPGGANAGRLWIIGGVLLLVLWLVFTSFHVISPEQRGVVTVLGRYAGTLEPGIQFTAPAPIASVAKIDVQRIRTEDFPTGSGENLMLTSDQNIIDLAYSVRWDIRNPEEYVFQLANPTETVRATAESAMRAVIANTTLNSAIGAGRAAMEAQVVTLMQEILDSYGAGVRVQGVAIKQASAPAAVDEDFKAVTAAQQEAQGNLNQARAYAQQVLARAQGDAAEFDKIYEQYKIAPDVTKRRLYYETMEEVLAKADKTIVEARGVTPYIALPELKRPGPAPSPAPGAPQPKAAGQ